MNLVTSHFCRLGDFAGRENREPFWLWVLVLLVAQFVLSVVAQLPLQLTVFQLHAQSPAGPPNEPAVPDPAQFAAAFHSMFMFIFIFSIVIGLVFFALIAAAAVRRLHDGNRSGYWALPPAVFGVAAQAIMVWFMIQMMAVFRHPAGTASALFDTFPWALIFVIWLGGFISSVVLLILLVLPGTDGPNRFGEDPLADYRAWLRERALNPEAPPRPARVVRGEEG